MDQMPTKHIPKLFFIVLVLGAAGTVFTLLERSHLNSSAALYIGLPLLLAIGMSLLPATKSAMGATMKGITIGFLLAAVVLREGSICIIFAAPIFYGVGAIIAGMIDYSRRKSDQNSKVLSMVAIAIVLLLSTEGTLPATTFDRENAVEVSKVVNASRDDILAQLTKEITFDKDRPMFLRLFRYPVAVTPIGLKIGDETRISFVYFKHVWWSKVAGNLVLRTIESTPDKIAFSAASDDSYLSHYLQWQASVVTFKPINDQQTLVTWRLEYKRLLDPAWYFGTLQHFAVRQAAEQLIDNVAVPDG
jgi:hypothetical protein